MYRHNPTKERTVKKSAFALLTVLALAGTSNPTNAATRYVWQDSPNPNPPYANWATAAHVIQNAVDAAVEGDTVLVTDGVYATGGRAVVGIMTNRVAIDRAITLLSVNGPEVTVIEGASQTRCVYLGTNALVKRIYIEEWAYLLLASGLRKGNERRRRVV